MKKEPLFYIARTEEIVAGPYDLVQMAGLLRKKIITVDTLTRLEGEEEWQPFGWQSHFSVVREIPADAVSMRVDTLDEEATAPNSPIPLPSRETLTKLGMTAILLLVMGGLSYLLAKLDPTMGMILEIVGAGIGLVAQCLILARLLDEDALTIVMVFFIPLFDIFYFLSNIWEYFPYFCAKYGGIVVAMAAAAAMATGSSH